MHAVLRISCVVHREDSALLVRALEELAPGEFNPASIGVAVVDRQDQVGGGWTAYLRLPSIRAAQHAQKLLHKQSYADLDLETPLPLRHLVATFTRRGTHHDTRSWKRASEILATMDQEEDPREDEASSSQEEEEPCPPIDSRLREWLHTERAPLVPGAFSYPVDLGPRLKTIRPDGKVRALTLILPAAQRYTDKDRPLAEIRVPHDAGNDAIVYLPADLVRTFLNTFC